MREDQKKILEQQLWNIANTLRGYFLKPSELFSEVAASSS